MPSYLFVLFLPLLIPLLLAEEYWPEVAIVGGSLGLPQAQVANFQARENTIMIAARDIRAGYFVCFEPNVRDKSGAKFGVYEFDDSPEGYALLRSTETPLVAGASSGEVSTRGGVFVIRVTDISVNILPYNMPKNLGCRRIERASSFGRSGGGNCCFSCGSLTVCSSSLNSVSMACGSCG